MKKTYSLLLILAIIIVYSLFSLWTPWGLDDWTFAAEWRDVIGEYVNFSSLYSFWSDIRLYDNGRFSNTLIPVFLLYSPWKEIFPLLTGISAALILSLVSYFSFKKHSLSVFHIILVWVASIFLLPWRSGLFIADYSINYIWSAALTMLFIAYVLRYEHKGWNVWKTVLVLFIAFIAGGWHEGFAIPTIVGFFIYTLTSRRQFSVQWWIIGVFYAGIAVANYLCPGMMVRTSNEIGWQPVEFSIIKTLVDFLPIVLLILMLVVLCISKRGRERIRESFFEPIFTIASGIVATGLFLSLLFVHQPRSAFWPDIMAIVMLFVLTRPIWNKIYGSAYRIYLDLLMLAMVSVPMLFSLSEQYAYYKEAIEIVDKLERSETGTIFYDIREPAVSSILTLKMPTHALWKTAYQYESLKNFTTKPTAAVVPTELERKDYRKVATEMPGGTGLHKIGKELFFPTSFSEATPHIEKPWITLKNGDTGQAVALFLPYIAPDGEEWIWVKIYDIPTDEIQEIVLPG